AAVRRHPHRNGLQLARHRSLGLRRHRRARLPDHPGGRHLRGCRLRTREPAGRPLLRRHRPEDPVLVSIEPISITANVQGRSLGRDALKRFFRHSTGMVGLFVVTFFGLAALLAPVLTPYDAARDRALRARLAPPSAEHWFGADELGRDQFSRVWHGGRISLRVGLLAVAFAAVTGTVLGLASGYVGGWLDTFIVWLMDIVLA